MQFNTPYGTVDDQSASYICGLEEGLAIGAITGGVGAFKGNSYNYSALISGGECIWKLATEKNLEATISYIGYQFYNDAVIDAYAQMYSEYGFTYNVTHDETISDTGVITRKSCITTWFDNIRHDKWLVCSYNPKASGFSYPVKRGSGVYSALYYGNNTAPFGSTIFWNDANAIETDSSITVRLGVIDSGGIFVPHMGLGAKNGMFFAYFPNANLVYTNDDNTHRASDVKDKIYTFVSTTKAQLGGGDPKRLCLAPLDVISEQDRAVYGVSEPTINGVATYKWIPIPRLNGAGYGNIPTYGVWIKPLAEDKVYYAQCILFSGVYHVCILGDTTPDKIGFYNS